MEQLQFVGDFMFENLMRIWPYLLLTVPLAVAVNLSGAAKHIRRVFDAGPLLAIVLATAVGAFSPFCSCTVIPVVASLLIGGVPLAPVMSFWIASPAMDPEIFLLSVGMLGYELALWRLVGTLLLSFGAGLLTHLIMQRGWLGEDILRLPNARGGVPTMGGMVGASWQRVRRGAVGLFGKSKAEQSATIPLESVMTATAPVSLVVTAVPRGAHGSCCSGKSGSELLQTPATGTILPGVPVRGEDAFAAGDCCGNEAVGDTGIDAEPFRRRLLRETWGATKMVVQFMLLAFLLEALILLFVPEAWISELLGAGNRFAVPFAALLGVPVYTSNLTALPLIAGLLEQGMLPGAALAFLIAGPITTLPGDGRGMGIGTAAGFLLCMSP
jgi:uncharacterized membrane protein YraQ (UPF0718 family)